MPSGVRMRSEEVMRFVLRIRDALKPKEPDEHRELEDAERDLLPVADDRLVILREERLDDARPDEHHGDAVDEHHQIGADGAQPGIERSAIAAADERPAEDQPALAGDEDGGDLDDAVRQQPAEEEDRLAREDVIDGDHAEDDAVVEKSDDRADAEGHAERRA